MDFLSTESVSQPKSALPERGEAVVPRGVCPRILLDQIRNTAPFVLAPIDSEESGELIPLQLRFQSVLRRVALP